jgi:hypothetical protein
MVRKEHGQETQDTSIVSRSLEAERVPNARDRSALWKFFWIGHFSFKFLPLTTCSCQTAWLCYLKKEGHWTHEEGRKASNEGSKTSKEDEEEGSSQEEDQGKAEEEDHQEEGDEDSACRQSGSANGPVREKSHRFTGVSEAAAHGREGHSGTGHGERSEFTLQRN